MEQKFAGWIGLRESNMTVNSVNTIAKGTFFLPLLLCLMAPAACDSDTGAEEQHEELIVDRSQYVICSSTDEITGAPSYCADHYDRLLRQGAKPSVAGFPPPVVCGKFDLIIGVGLNRRAAGFNQARELLVETDSPWLSLFDPGDAVQGDQASGTYIFEDDLAEFGVSVWLPFTTSDIVIGELALFSGNSEREVEFSVRLDHDDESCFLWKQGTVTHYFRAFRLFDVSLRRSFPRAASVSSGRYHISVGNHEPAAAALSIRLFHPRPIRKYVGCATRKKPRVSL
ncbi:MAG: hypothetical protein M5R36_28450 [Deltaproteobacteria bacterium]|nr:hypothetical protein [Deltaproteobacteria bacterium]